MLCLKNYHKTGFGILLSVFFAVLSVFFFSNTNVSAVSDISVTYNSGDSVSSWGDVFPSCSSSSCLKDYHYLIVSSSTPSNFLPSFSLYVRDSSGWTPHFTVQFYESAIYYLPFSDPSYSAYLLEFYSSFTFSSTVTFTLTESLSPGAPSGSITLTENGSFDVSSYATAVVDVPPVIEPGDYHDDLVSIQQAIYVCGAILLVLYFFYCIYRMIIKTTGGYL